MREGLTFDDILLVPQFSTIKSRDEVDLSVNFGPFKFASPIIPANMKTVISFDMAQAVVDSGGLVILHRFENQLEQERKFYNIQHSGMFKPVAASIGVKEPDYLHWFFYSNCFILCIDIAHGDSLAALETIRAIRRMQDKWPVYLIAGNVATGEAAKRLFKEGVDAVKIGVGPGGNCSTRRVTGNGVPQLTAILDVNDVRNEDFPDRKIIADGGIRNSGDVVKALAAGADFTMLGQFFAGCDEAPGAKVTVDGVDYKCHEGSSTYKDRNIEGVRGLVKCSGPFKNVLEKLLEGVRSGLSYQGCRNIDELHQLNGQTFMKITNSGLIESHPHDIMPL